MDNKEELKNKLVLLDDYLEAVKKQFKYFDVQYATAYIDFKSHKEEEVRNALLNQLIDCDFVFITDADEFYLQADIKTIIKEMERKKADAGLCNVLNYQKGLKEVYTDRKHQPLIIVDPKKVKFYDGRCARGFSNPIYFNKIYMHHLGLTFSANQMEWKQNNYWNKGNINEIADIINSETRSNIIPEEILQIITDHRG